LIAYINQRPAIQIGPCQVIDYDTMWLEDAILRAAKDADHENFSMAPEIRQGVEMYLESRCSLRLQGPQDARQNRLPSDCGQASTRCAPCHPLPGHSGDGGRQRI
jgi:hypothetical protein